MSIAFSGAGLESWLHRRRLLTVTYDQVDQLDIARDLVDRAQDSDPASSLYMGITTGGQVSSGVLRDREYSTADYAMIGERLVQLSEVINGPEWHIRTFVDPDTGERVREFYVAQVLGTGTVHRISQPGTLMGWTHTTDATEATTFHVVRSGPDESGTRYRTTRVQLPMSEGGWPRLEAVHEYPNVKPLTGTVGAYADWWVEHRSHPRRTMDATVQVPEEPTLTPEHIGDVARLVVVNPWWPLDETGAPTFDEARRIVGMEVRPPERGPEEMQLIFAEPRDDGAAADGYGRPQYPASVADMLAHLPERLRAILSGTAPMGS